MAGKRTPGGSVKAHQDNQQISKRKDSNLKWRSLSNLR